MTNGCMEEVAYMLRFFADIRNYSYIDRIANALTPGPAEMALQEAIRHLRSLYDASFEVDKDGKKLRAVKIGDKTYILPKMPSESCVREVLEAIRDGSHRRKLAILSLAFGR